MVVVAELSREIIDRVLRELEAKGLLLEHTVPLETRLMIERSSHSASWHLRPRSGPIDEIKPESVDLTPMGLPVEKGRYTVAEYLERELHSAERHEYHDGEILAMSGGSDTHSFIIANVIREFGNALKGHPCSVAEGNLRVRNRREPRYVYPDASVICGEREYDPEDPNRHTILNPRVIVEVLSPTTEAYDRGDKFDYYRGIDALDEYVLIAQDRPAVQTFLRQPDGTWSLKGFVGLDATLRLRCLPVAIPLAEIYYRIEFPARPAPPPTGG